jgi:hypothetical protein
MSKPLKDTAVIPTARFQGAKFGADVTPDGRVRVRGVVRRHFREGILQLFGKLHTLRAGSALSPEKMAELIKMVEQPDRD